MRRSGSLIYPAQSSRDHVLSMVELESNLSDFFSILSNMPVSQLKSLNNKMVTVSFHAYMLGDTRLTQLLDSLRQKMNQVILYFDTTVGEKVHRSSTTRVPLLTIDFQQLQQDLLETDKMLQGYTTMTSKVLSSYLVDLSRTLVSLADLFNSVQALNDISRPVIYPIPTIQFTGALNDLMVRLQSVSRHEPLPETSFQMLTTTNQNIVRTLMNMVASYEPLTDSVGTFFIPDIPSIMIDSDFEQDTHLSKFQNLIREAFSATSHTPDEESHKIQQASTQAMQEMNDIVGPMFPGVYVAFNNEPVLPTPVKSLPIGTITSDGSDLELLTLSKFPPNNNSTQNHVSAQTISSDVFNVLPSFKNCQKFTGDGTIYI